MSLLVVGLRIASLFLTLRFLIAKTFTNLLLDNYCTITYEIAPSTAEDKRAKVAQSVEEETTY